MTGNEWTVAQGGPEAILGQQQRIRPFRRHLHMHKPDLGILEARMGAQKTSARHVIHHSLRKLTLVSKL